MGAYENQDAAAVIRYVKEGASGNGNTWATASGELQAMIDQSQAGNQVWVAAGTYQPNLGHAFNMKGGVKVYGGFPATGTPEMTIRNWNTNLTNLSGNGHSVIQNINTAALALLDGFTISGGNNTYGGGINNYGCSPTFSNIKIYNNRGSLAGGGISNIYSSPELINVTISGNISGNGGGIFNQNSSPALTNVTISGNASQEGGGVYNQVFSSPIIRNSIIYNNSSGIYNSNGSSVPVINFSLIQGLPANVANNNPDGSVNPLFVNPAAPGQNTDGDYTLLPGSPAINAGNNSYYTGLDASTKDLDGNPRLYGNAIDMGAYENQDPSSIIRYVKQGGTGNGNSWATASGNFQAMINASSSGNQIWVAAGTFRPAAGSDFRLKEGVKIYGGFPSSNNNATMADRNWVVNISKLQGNGYSVINNNSNNLTTASVVDGFTITGGSAQFGGGICNTNSSPTLRNLIISGNIGHGSGGGIHNTNSSPLLTDVTISGNTAGDGGGIFNSNSSPILTNVIITGNVLNYNAGRGGGICNFQSSPTLTNVTVSGNKAGLAAAIYNYLSNPTLQNSIIHGNSSGIYDEQSTPQIYNSLVQGITSTGNGNIGGDTNPLFVNAPSYTTAPFTGGDYSLSVLSPVINKGVNSFLPGGITTDLAGNPRVYDNGIIDMGAYEYQGNPECAITTTWTGSGWDNGIPTSTVYAAVINGDYTSAADLTACSLTVAGGTVVVNSGDNFIIKGKVTVNNPAASLTFENDANLVQADNIQNAGNIVYKRNSNPLQYLDYTLWSSPTSGTQTLKAFSPQTLNDRFYVYNTPLNAYSNYTSASGAFGTHPNAVTFTPGKGYLIRMPAGLPASPPTGPALTSVFQGVFTGVPNNGDISIALGTGGNRFNAVGNPYPSPVNIWNFIDANNGQLDNGTLYLWRKTNNSAATTYATVTKLDYIANQAEGGNAGGEYTGSASGWAISAGQGFFVKAAAGANALVFNNSMRRAVNNTRFFRMPSTFNASPAPEVELSRYKVDIKNTASGFGQACVGYTGLTTNGLDYGWDGRLLNDGELCVYTTADNARLGIQAREAFTTSDVVPLGYKTANAGSLTLSLHSLDGLFAQGQDIYLKDNELGTMQNLKLDSYTFLSQAGTFDTRFSIVYADEALGTVDSDLFANDILVYKQEGVLHVASGRLDMQEIEVYDIRGRLIYSKDKVNSTHCILSGLEAQEQMLIVKVKGDNGSSAAKKVIY